MSSLEKKPIVGRDQSSKFWSSNDRLSAFQEFHLNTFKSKVFDVGLINYSERYGVIATTNFKRDQDFITKPNHFTLKDFFGNGSFSGNSKAKEWRLRMVKSFQVISFFTNDFDMILDIEEMTIDTSLMTPRFDVDLLEKQLKRNQILQISWRSFADKNGDFKTKNFKAWSLFFNTWSEFYYPAIHRELINI